MNYGGSFTSGETTGGKCGCAVAAIIGLPLAFIVFILAGFTQNVFPRHGDYQMEAQLIFWGGLLAGAIFVGGVGLLVRKLVNGWLARRQTD